MARVFSELRSGMTPERRRRNDERVEQELRLYDLSNIGYIESSEDLEGTEDSVSA